MSLILGIYSKHKKINIKNFKEVINDFSLYNKRKVKLNLYKNKLLLANTISEYNDSIIIENKNKSKVLALSGIIHKMNNITDYIFEYSDNLTDKLLNSLNGNFTFALYNLKKDQLILVNDYFGTYPLFYYNSNDIIIFCNEYDPIVKYSKFIKTINKNAIAEFISLGMPLEEKTFFKSIINIMPATILNINNDNINIRKYDNLNIKKLQHNNINYYASQIVNKMKKIISLRYKKTSNITMSLTGGADTRLILNFLSLNQRSNFKYVTYKSLNLTKNEDKDVIISQIIAKKFKLNHEIFDNSLYKKNFNKNYFKRRRYISNNNKYIGGINGGELLGGCCFSICPINIDNRNKDDIKNKLKLFFTEDFLNSIYDPYINLINSIRKISSENKTLYLNITQLTRSFFTNIYGGSKANWLEPYYVLLREDSIFFDTGFLKLLLSIPNKYLKNYLLYNLIYKEYVNKSLLEIPSNSIMTKNKDYELKPILFGIDPKAVKKPKYLKSLNKYFNSKKTWDRNIYNYEYLKSIIKNEQHPHIKQFLDLEAWFRYYID